ncbi:hypothetical protein V1264_011390 [Littorina saxatilis]|uniref:PLAT domain-containing protein n=1 Tax=Littorina saxatilis TaxID=31220 RepID=A0AAN9BUW2_9CAEN
MYLPLRRCTAGSVCHQLPNGYLVLKSARLGLSAECQNCPDTDVLDYNWNISLSSFRWPDGWRPLQQIDIEKNRTIGAKSKEISLQPSLFEAFKEFKVYKAKVSVTRAGVTGWAATQIKLNDPPTGGECSIEPKVADVSRKKLFRIVCSNWSDDTGIDEFRFFSFFDEQSVKTQITVVKTPRGSVDLNVTLSQGAHYLDYNNSVRVVIRDTMGASTEYTIDTVRVLPVSTDVVRAMTDDLRNNPTSDLTKKFAEGDLITCTEFVTTIAAMLNSDSKTSQTEYQNNAITSTKSATALGPYDADRVGAYTTVSEELSYAEQRAVDMQRDNRAEVRKLILDSITQMPNNTMLGRTQIMSAIAETLRYPDEVTAKTQMIVIDALENYANKLDDGQDVTPEEREQNMNYLIAGIGGAMDAAGTTGFEGTLTELKEAADDELFLDYPTENVAIDDDCLLENPPAYDFDAAFTRQQRLTNCRLTRVTALLLADKAVQVLNSIRNSYLQNSIEGESQQFNTDRMRTKLKKTSAKHVFNEPQKLEFSTAEFAFPSDMNDIFPNGLVGENDTLLVQMSENSNTPYRYMKTAKAIPKTTRFVSLDLFKGEGAGDKLTVTGLSKPIKIKIPRSNDQPPLDNKMVDPLLASWNKFQLHKTSSEFPGSSLHAEICPTDPTVQYVVVVNFGEVPDPELGLCNKSFLVPANMSDPDRPTCSKIYMDNLEMADYVGEVYLGFRQLTTEEMGMDVSNCTQLPAWGNGTDGSNESATGSNFTGNYTLKLFGSGCYAITPGDSDWSTLGCRVHQDTDDSMTVCECTHLTTFAGGWVVVPNTIDWNYVFNNFDFYSNPTLYITEIVILTVFIVAFIWARRKDRKDLEQLGIAPLMDNDSKDKYYYEIVVVTGMRRNAGTDSKVYFILSGEDDETDVREFSDHKRKIFRRGATNGFLMSCPRPLGYLNYARIWHDNSGKGNMGSWYLNYMIVRDVQTDEKWVFIADKWFAVEEDDGQVDRIVPVATREAMTEFGHLFAERTRKNLADGHLWFSVVARPPQSRFTAVQRVSCCLCLLYASMLANAMFYRSDGEEKGVSSGITFGPFSISGAQIWIGIISNLIVFPVNFIIILLFRKARPRKLRPSRVDEAIKTAFDGPRTTASVNDVKPEVSSIFSVSRPTSAMTSPKPRPESSMSRPGTSLSARADGALPNKKQKKSLPWWCRIVAWVILILTTLLCAAFVTFYGISFSDEVCKKWISSMLISFFMSVFITQPIKVFLIAIFLSLLVKNPGEEDEEDEALDEETTRLAKDEIPLHDMNADTYGAARPRKIGYKPPDRKELDAARERRLKEIQMWAIVREVVVYSFFLWILLVISYRQRNGDTFLYKDTMERVFIKNNESDIDFGKIRNQDEYWNWTRSGLVNGIRAGAYYNDYPPLMLRGFVNDKVSKILGYATMRQVRIRPSLCEMDERMLEVVRECNIEYEISGQEEATFDKGWVPRTDNSTVNDTDPWYTYTDSDTLNSYPYWGKLAMYSGGGYVVPLKGSKTDLKALMNKLEGQEWIDRYTRAVFVEFTTYNAQVNLFGIANILAEFHPTGGVVQSYRFEPAMLLPYMTQAMLFQLVCEGVYCLFIIFFIIRLLKAFIKEKLAFFKGFWNLVDMGIISMSIGAIVIYFYRLFETNKLTSRFKETNGLEYIKFQYVGYWNEIFTYMIGWTVFFATLKFMRLLRFNKRMSLLASTLRNGARSLLHFSVIFWIVFLAFAMLFFLSFMTVDIKYSSFIGSVVSGILMMMGKFDIYQLTMAEPVLTQIFVFLFVLSVTFIIVNMFVSILNETFSAVRDDINKQSNDYEIVSFMIGRFRRFTGLGGQPTTLTPEEQRNQEQEKRYAEGRGNSCVDDFPDRIDRLLHSISNVYMDQDNVNAMMDKKGYQHGDGGGGAPPMAAKGYDNLAYTGPKAKGRVSEMSKVHTH